MSAKRSEGAAEIAAEIVAGTGPLGIDHYARALDDGSKTAATQAARVLEEVIHQKPQLATPHIGRMVRLLAGDEPRVVQACANGLPELARVAPAKVAKHLGTLRDSYPGASEAGRDGLVRTFVALCLASIAYQKRLIDILEQALTDAEPKTLVRWAELVLPALKGEPHARAREVVEQRLGDLPRVQAQKVASLLGVKLRPSRV